LLAAIPIAIGLCALKPAASVANRDSVRDLIEAADAQGFESSPVFYLLCDDRTAEFYASGRLAYDSNGEPTRFEGAQDVAAAIRQKGGLRTRLNGDSLGEAANGLSSGSSAEDCRQWMDQYLCRADALVRGGERICSQLIKPNRNLLLTSSQSERRTA
jgi:hypothetical protein